MAPAFVSPITDLSGGILDTKHVFGNFSPRADAYGLAMSRTGSKPLIIIFDLNDLTPRTRWGKVKKLTLRRAPRFYTLALGTCTMLKT
jgi:hypothetical protein